MRQNSTSYDAVVVGGGPSGATSAYLLATKGFNICLVDKKDFPRPKLCAGLLTWKSIDLLNRVFARSRHELTAKGIITHNCRDYRIYLRSEAIVHGHLDFPFHFVNRISYDNFWLRMAQQAGCRVITGLPVTKVDPFRGVLTLSDGTLLNAETIIGADGVWSKVRQSISSRQSLNHKWHNQLAATIETVHTNPSLPGEENHASIYFGYLPWGYAWSFPGSGQQILGMGGLHRKGSASLKQNFHNFLKETTNADVDQLHPWRSHPLPYGNHLRNPTKGRVLLVGDACGLADPLLGEGIYYAHRSGELAAQAVIAAKYNGGCISEAYRSALNTHILKELRWIKLYRNLLFAGGLKRRYRGLRFLFHLMPKRLEATVQGQHLFSKLLCP